MQYYWPVMDYTTEKTLCFIDKKDTSNKIFWKIKTEIFLHDTVMRTIIYDKRGNKTESMTEVVTSLNSKLLTDTLYDYGATGRLREAPCKVMESWLFNGKQKVDASIRWSVSYKDLETKDGCKLSKERTLVKLEGGIATFKDDMLLEIPDQNLDYKYKIEAHYKKGQGLIDYTVSGGKAKTVHYVLQNYVVTD